jgi:4-hydroxythreonine-4-phosphate dehydrogenase
MSLPRIAITIGDPGGIGPEVVCKALSSSKTAKICQPVLIGNSRFIPDFSKLKKKVSFKFIEVPFSSPETFQHGRFSVHTGRFSYECILKAVELTEQGLADALVTGPVSKEAMLLAKVNFPGQTELLADLTGTKKFAMLMTAGRYRTAMVTRHLPVSQAGMNITIDEIKKTVYLSDKFLKEKAKISVPRICISSLNPHSGEGGILGKEERMVISPAVRILKEEGYNVTGPVACDSAWVKVKRNEFDMLVTMYHDQAMIGLKCLAAEKVVNITAGLPFIRTSPGHGTGFDIAGKNIADSRPMQEAVKAAAQ